MAGENPMLEIRIAKVTLNMGAGEPGQKLENARTLLGRVSGKTPVTTLARVRGPTWKIRKGHRGRGAAQEGARGGRREAEAALL